MNFNQKKVLITGGASGIGRIMGRKVLEKGAEQLIIWDINEANIANTLHELSKLGNVVAMQVDVSKLDAVQAAAAEVLLQHGHLDVLINNAGIVVGKYFHEHSDADIQRTMDINTLAPMHITQQFIGQMMQRNTGAICNIASAAGLLSNPKMSVYVASKWGVTGWSDSLRLEMEQLGKNIKVTTVMPYYITTGMFDGVKSSVVPLLEPEIAASKIIAGIEGGKIYVKMPLIVNFLRLAQGILPVRVFDLVIGKWLGIYKTMAEFVGRK